MKKQFILFLLFIILVSFRSSQYKVTETSKQEALATIFDRFVSDTLKTQQDANLESDLLVQGINERDFCNVSSSWAKLRADVTGNSDLLNYLKNFEPKVDRLKAWDIARRVGLEDAIRTNPNDLKKISDYQISTGRSSDDIISEIESSAITAAGSTRSWIDVVAVEGGETIGLLGNYVQKEGGEVFYRTISESDYQKLLSNGRLPATTETSTSPTQAFSADYNGVLIKYYVNHGTIDQLKAIGRTDGSSLVAEQFGEMPQGVSGWINEFARFKKEGVQVNIQLGRGPGVDIFNENLKAFEKIDL